MGAFSAGIRAALVAGAMAWGVTASAQTLPVPEFPVPDVTIPAEPGTLAHSIESDPRCRERTNGCERCALVGGGRLACTTPGLGCQPGRWHCVSEAARLSR